MAAITVTATLVLPGSGAQVVTGAVWGETVTAGMAVYRKGTDQKWYKAKASGTVDESGAGAAIGLGVALSGGAVNQRGEVQTSGPVTIGGTVTVGALYCLGPAAYGDVAPNADVVSTNYVTVLGVGISATQIQLAPVASGIVHA